MLVIDATTTTKKKKKKKKKKRKRERIKKSARCCCSPALSARSWIFGCPSFFFFSDGRREKDEMMIFVSLMRRVKETVVKREFVTNNSLSFSYRGRRMSSSSSTNNDFNNNERTTTIEISPNVFMPRLAFGTYKLKGAQCTKAVKKALEIGYEHIDTASIYKNESDIGEALEEWMTTTKTATNDDDDDDDGNVEKKTKKKERKMPFLASKIAPAEMHSKLLVEQAVEKILLRLRIPAIDLIMLHWPGVSKVSPDSEIHKEKRKDAYRALEKCLKEGKIRAIGVSNYHVRHLEELLSYCEIKPSVNQIEAHPMWPQEDLIEFCESKGIAVVKYSPFGGGGAPLLDDAFVSTREEEKEGGAGGGDEEREQAADIADDQAWKPSQILLAWGLLRGGRKNRGNSKTLCGAVVVKASSEERILENYEALEKDFFNSKYLSRKLKVWDSVETRKKFAWDSDCVK